MNLKIMSKVLVIHDMQIGPLNVISLKVIIVITMFMLLYFILFEKVRILKKMYPSSHFYKEYHDNKTRNMSALSYFNDHNSSRKPIYNMHPINT